MRAGIALGSNLGDRLANLRSAREEILRLRGIQEPLLLSPLYQTEPVGCEPGAGEFYNAVIEIGFKGEAKRLLQELQRIEASLGRRRDLTRKVSRTIDLDLLYFGDVVTNNVRLQLPHPRMHERHFVLAPLADIRPELILPHQEKPVSALLAQLGDNLPVVRMKGQW